MKNKLKKIIILIMLLIIVIIKILQINFIEKIKIKIENFEKSENSYFNEVLVANNLKTETTRIVKNNKIKEIIDYSERKTGIIRIIDLNKNEEIIITENSNSYKIVKNKQNYDIRINNLPKIIKNKKDIQKNLEKGNIFAIFYCFKILYIIPVNYNDIECYEIRTTREKLYVDRNTLYPIYLEYEQDNSSKNKEKVKIEYVFQENNVKDEDVEIPNLENYVLEQ